MFMIYLFKLLMYWLILSWIIRLSVICIVFHNTCIPPTWGCRLVMHGNSRSGSGSSYRASYRGSWPGNTPVSDLNLLGVDVAQSNTLSNCHSGLQGFYGDPPSVDGEGVCAIVHDGTVIVGLVQHVQLWSNLIFIKVSLVTLEEKTTYKLLTRGDYNLFLEYVQSRKSNRKIWSFTYINENDLSL